MMNMVVSCFPEGGSVIALPYCQLSQNASAAMSWENQKTLLALRSHQQTNMTEVGGA